MKHVIFDFDGVIADTFDFHRAEILNMFGVELFPHEYRDMHDGNFYNHTNEKMLGLDFTSYAASVSERQSLTIPFPGAIETIKDFAKGYTLHLVTSGWEVQIRPFMQKHDIESCFQTFMCADKGTSKHEKLERLMALDVDTTAADYVFVTDTVGDIKESHMAGIQTLAVTFGFHEKERLQNANPEFMADSWDEIVTIIEKLFPR